MVATNPHMPKMIFYGAAAVVEDEGASMFVVYILSLICIELGKIV